MTTIESRPDVVEGDVVIGPWRHHGLSMRGELFRSASAAEPARVVVWLVNSAAGRKWQVCDAKAAYTISEVVFTEPFARGEHSSAAWEGSAAARLAALSPLLWRRTVTAQLTGAYMQAACACEEVPC